MTSHRYVSLKLKRVLNIASDARAAFCVAAYARALTRYCGMSKDPNSALETA